MLNYFFFFESPGTKRKHGSTFCLSSLQHLQQLHEQPFIHGRAIHLTGSNQDPRLSPWTPWTCAEEQLEKDDLGLDYSRDFRCGFRFECIGSNAYSPGDDACFFGGRLGKDYFLGIPLDPNRFNPYTGSLLAPLMIPRVSGTANNTLVQQFILDHFAALNQTSPGDGSAPVDDSGDNSQKKKRSKHGWHVEQDRFEEMTPYGMKTFTNLIFTKNPKATNRLVFAAHFDSKYFPPPNAPFSPNGALDRMGQRLRGNGGDDTLPFTAGTDSAVPCAILLDLAASLDQALEDQMWANTNRAAQAGWEEDEETTLQFVFFDGEEAFVDWTATDSLYGSRHLAELWAKRTVPKVRLATGRNGGSTSNNLEGIELFVLLDLLGVENPRIPSYFGTTQWAHRHILSIEERLWQSKLHGTQLLANKQRRALLQAQNVEERAGEEEEDEMDRLEEEAIEIETPLHAYLTEDAAYGGVDDDHRPFLHKGVPILHIIPTPFPHVWHTLQDDAKAIKPEVVEGWTNIFRVFTAEYLQLLHPRTRQNPRHDEL